MIVDPDTCVRLPELSATKRGLLEKRLRGGLKTRTATAAIPRRVPAEHAPLSFAQQRLWFSYQLAPERPLYNICVALRLQGRLDCVALEKSLAAIVARHESLRTRYVCVGDEPFQVIDGSPAVRLAVVDLKAVSEGRNSTVLTDETARELVAAATELLEAFHQLEARKSASVEITDPRRVFRESRQPTSRSTIRFMVVATGVRSPHHVRMRTR